MGFIPSDLFRRGKSTLTLERHTNFLYPGAYSDIIASSVGLGAEMVDQSYKFTASTAGGLGYIAGFTTKPVKMKNGDDRLAWAAELILGGVYVNISLQKKIVFSDGTNSITVYSEDNAYDGSTLYSATIGGEAVSGTLATCFNISGTYSSCRGVTDALVVRVNLSLRIDVARGTISLWSNDQIKGEVAITGLDQFGDSAFTISAENATVSGRYMMIKDIGVRVDC